MRIIILLAPGLAKGTAGQEQGRQGPSREGIPGPAARSHPLTSGACPESAWPVGLWIRIHENGRQGSGLQGAGGGGREGAEACFIQSQFRVVTVTSVMCARNGLFVLFTKNELPAPLLIGQADLRVWLLVINPSTQRLVTALRAAGH